jgi:hypothetical protein
VIEFGRRLAASIKPTEESTMTAQVSKPARVISSDTLEALDAASIKIMCADGTMSAILNTFDQETSHTSMKGESLVEAIFAAHACIQEARKLLGAIA